jgi:hypothetical protein
MLSVGPQELVVLGGLLLLLIVQANDDLTLEEHPEALQEEFGEEVSTSTIGRAIAGLPQGGWPLKKRNR